MILINRMLNLVVFSFTTNTIFVQSFPKEDVENNDMQCTYKERHSICLTPECVNVASDVLSDIDESVDPCHDFYNFACGGYLKKTSIPEDKAIAISFSTTNDYVLQQLKTVMEEPSESSELKSFSLVKKLYQVCLNTSYIENTGLRTVKLVSKRVGEWPVLVNNKWNEEQFDWTSTMSKLRNVGILLNSFISVTVAIDARNSSQYILNCDPGVLGLHREYLIEGLENKVVKAYYEYLVDIAVEFGAVKQYASKEIKQSVEFEIELAKISPKSELYRNITAITNVMTVAQLQKEFPSIQWKKYINDIIGITDLQITDLELINVSVPVFITNLEKLLKRTPKRVQANYIFSQLAMESVTYLTKSLRKKQLKFKGVSIGTAEFEPRWKECIDNALEGIDIAAGAMYVRKYFNEDAKMSAMELISDLHAAFINILNQVDWLDEKTRKKALEKANKMVSHIAYPKEFLDDNALENFYSKLNFSSNDYFENILSLGKFKIDLSFSKLHQIVNKTDWVTHGKSTTVNAYYSFSENSVSIPAGILQGAFFNYKRPKYMNYGAIGGIVGHEITHGFDDIGRQYDKDGELSDWWEEITRASFMQKAECVIEQYGNYTQAELKMKLNGVNTQGENIADIGGIKEAYLAYKLWVKRNGEEPMLPGLKYTPLQLFWISFANAWCSKQREEYLLQQILTDEHSPSYFRIIGSVKNSEFFSKDFNCPLGEEMNPKLKCHIW